MDVLGLFLQDQITGKSISLHITPYITKEIGHVITQEFSRLISENSSMKGEINVFQKYHLVFYLMNEIYLVVISDIDDFPYRSYRCLNCAKSIIIQLYKTIDITRKLILRKLYGNLFLSLEKLLHTGGSFNNIDLENIIIRHKNFNDLVKKSTTSSFSNQFRRMVKKKEVSLEDKNTSMLTRRRIEQLFSGKKGRGFILPVPSPKLSNEMVEKILGPKVLYPDGRSMPSSQNIVISMNNTQSVEKDKMTTPTKKREQNLRIRTLTPKPRFQSGFVQFKVRNLFPAFEKVTVKSSSEEDDDSSSEEEENEGESSSSEDDDEEEEGIRRKKKVYELGTRPVEDSRSGDLGPSTPVALMRKVVRAKNEEGGVISEGGAVLDFTRLEKPLTCFLEEEVGVVMDGSTQRKYYFKGQVRVEMCKKNKNIIFDEKLDIMTFRLELTNSERVDRFLENKRYCEKVETGFSEEDDNHKYICRVSGKDLKEGGVTLLKYLIKVKEGTAGFVPVKLTPQMKVGGKIMMLRLVYQVHPQFPNMTMKCKVTPCPDHSIVKVMYKPEDWGKYNDESQILYNVPKLEEGKHSEMLMAKIMTTEDLGNVEDVEGFAMAMLECPDATISKIEVKNEKDFVGGVKRNFSSQKFRVNFQEPKESGEEEEEEEEEQQQQEEEEEEEKEEVIEEEEKVDEVKGEEEEEGEKENEDSEEDSDELDLDISDSDGEELNISDDDDSQDSD